MAVRSATPSRRGRGALGDVGRLSDDQQGQASVTPTSNATAGAYTVTAMAFAANNVTFTEKTTPTVSFNSTSVAATATTLTISGIGFSTIAAHDTVAFDNGVTGSITSSTGTSLTVSITGLNSLIADTALHAVVTVDSASSSSQEVALVAPVVTLNSTIIPATSTTLTIAGYGFDPNTANDSVSFDNGVTGTVTSATSTSLTVGFGTDRGDRRQILHASATVDGIASGSGVEVAVVAPVVTASSTVKASATSLIIAGFGFDDQRTTRCLQQRCNGYGEHGHRQQLDGEPHLGSSSVLAGTALDGRCHRGRRQQRQRRPGRRGDPERDR